MQAEETKTIAVKGNILHFIADPFSSPEENSFQYFENGLLVIQDGIVKQVGFSSELEKQLPPETDVFDYRGHLILPGFVDSHLHYPQTDIIGSFGKQLLDWLQTYTFPCEGKFEDQAYAENVAGFFIEELLRNGTTTAQVMPTSHFSSADILFRRSAEKNMRMITGKIMMDRNAPDYLLDSPESGFDQSLELIEKWHNKKRLSYAVSPRFAVTSSDAQLEKTAELMETRPDLYLQTHLSENKDEIKLVAELFPWSQNYLDVYDRFGLVRKRSTFAHSIHLPIESYQKLSDQKAAVSFCPTSNLFIGSGLFDLEKTKNHQILMGMGTDIGGGTSFSMLKTLGEAYKVLQLKGQALSPLKAFYAATLGGAEALCLDDRIGSFQCGREADFVVLNSNATPLIQRRMEMTSSLIDKLFILMTLGDDRSIEASFVMGKKLYEKT
jgi:guanine deaminase